VTVDIDKSGANTAAIEEIRADSGMNIGLRQSKYLDNIVEQDHRAKGQLGGLTEQTSSPADQFYSLAFSFDLRQQRGFVQLHAPI
jgi:transposase-like protein